MTRSDSLRRVAGTGISSLKPTARHLPSGWPDRLQTLLRGAFAAYKTQMEKF